MLPDHLSYHASRHLRTVSVIAAILLAAADSRTLASTPIACGQLLSGTIGSPSEQDIYTFGAQTGDVVSIGLVELPGGSASFNPYWDLRAPNGSLVVNSCGSMCQSPALSVPGTYTIWVYDSGSNGTGSYAISLEGVSATLNGSPDCAEPIACGNRLVREIDSLAEMDTFKFDAQAGDVVSIGLAGLPGGSASFDPYWHLFAPNGSLVVNSCGSMCQSPALSVQGTYTIVVYDSGFNGTGSYAIYLAGVSAALNGSPDCAEPAVCGNTLVRDIGSLVEMDTFKFEAQTGDVVRITLVELPGGSTGFDPYWRLFAPNGSLVVNSCGSVCQSPSLSVQGTYTLVVYDSGFNGTGCYEFTLLSLLGTLNGLPCDGGGPVLTAAVSEKTHDSAGAFSINPLAAGATEDRTGGPTRIVATFDVPIQVASCVGGISLTSGSVSDLAVAGDQLILDISGAADHQPLTIGFRGVADATDASRTSASTLCVRPLVGDADNNGTVNIFDLIAIRNALNQPVTTANFRCDVNADGLINIFDLITTRNNLNRSVSACP